MQQASQSLQAELAALEEEGEKLKDAAVEAAKAEAEFASLKERSSQLSLLIADIDKTYSDYSEYRNAAEQHAALLEKSAALQSEYARLNRAFLEAQAGIIATSLKEGEPCPVCGSVHHPAPATAKEAPSATELDAAKSDYEKAAHREGQASVRAGQLKGAYEVRAEQVRLAAAKHIKLNGDEKLKDIKEALNEAYSGVNLQTAQCERRIKQLKSDLARLDKIKSTAAAGVEKKEKYASALAKALLEISGAESAKLQLDGDILQLKGKLAFPDKSAVLTEIARCEEQKRALEEQAERARAAFTACDKRVGELEAQLNNLNGQLAGVTATDMRVLNARAEQVEISRVRLAERIKSVHYRIQTNVRCLEDLNAVFAEAGETEKKYRWVKALSDTANGTLAGKEKIMLETYVQAAYFDRVIVRANRRLLVMTDNQYELKRRRSAENNRSQSGLELDVVDHYNGTERSVKTLSGGESFKASLSLALGLSEEIQSSAGGIKLDTMFVDEGFGSLDNRSLQQAIRALEGLSEGNRLVGIISHVAELKEKIERQVVIKKDKCGGSRIEIV